MEADGLGLVDPYGVVRPTNLVDDRLLWALEGEADGHAVGAVVAPAARGVIESGGDTGLERRFDEVEGNELLAQRGESTQEVGATGEWDAREVDLEKLGV